MSDHVWRAPRFNMHTGRRMPQLAADAEMDALLALTAHGCQFPLALLCAPCREGYWPAARFGFSGEEAARLCGCVGEDHRSGFSSPSDTLPKEDSLLRRIASRFPDLLSCQVEWLEADDAPAVLLVCDRKERDWGMEQRQLLATAAAQILRLVELRALKDRFCGAVQDPEAQEPAALREREERFRLIAEATNDALWDWNLTENSIWCSEWLSSIFAGPGEDWSDWAERIHPQDRPGLLRSLQDAVESSQQDWRGCCRLLRGDGSYAWFEGRGHIVRSSEGTPVRMVGSARDVTAQRVKEEELRRLEERFAIAFRANPEPMAITALDDGTLIDANDAYLHITGYAREETIGHTTHETGLWSSPAARREVIAQLMAAGRIKNLEVSLRVRSGATWLGLLSAEIVEIDGRRCILSVVKDITELRRLEAQLRQAQKMDAIGRLAGGIAHDFNNFLTILHGYCEVLLAQVPELPDQARNYVLEMRTAAERAAGLTRQLLAFSRQQILRLQVLDLNRLLRSSDRMLRSALNSAIDFRMVLDPDLGRIQADSSQIDQIVLNLIMNARDALPEGGSITVETGNVDYRQPTRFGRDTVPAGRWILLSVKDTGHGMSAHVQARIFEPFYTTKEEGKGTGLGLATVYGIIKQSGGHVAVSSEPGFGSTFELLFTRFDAPIAVRSPESPSLSACEGNETILLVEDEDAIRLLCSEVLESQGYQVIAARDGQDALRQAAQTSGAIHLLATDVILPKLGGPALAKTLRQQHPRMAILYMSGFPEPPQPAAAARDEWTLFLQKPFSPARLSRAIRDLLDHACDGQAAGSGR